MLGALVLGLVIAAFRVDAERVKFGLSREDLSCTVDRNIVGYYNGPPHIYYKYGTSIAFEPGN